MDANGVSYHAYAPQTGPIGARSTNIVVTASDRVRIEDMKTYVNASFSQNGGVRHAEIDQDFADKSYSLHNGSARVQIDI